jgi:predicted NBD/HSP70 family sugar kinase
MTRSKLRPEDARRSNRALVLQAIVDHPGRSRADLARATGLTKVTVSDLVAELIDAGLVRESGTRSDVRPGKPSTRLEFIPDARDLLAIDLSARDKFRGAVISLAGKPVRVIERPLDGAVGTDALAAAHDLARQLLTTATHPVLGIGVGTPGTVSADGVVISAPNLAWHDLHLQAELAEALGIPVLVQNDANVAVLAERRFAGLSGDLARIHLSRGVGAGLLVGGHLVHGATSDAGEIGHVVIDPDGPACTCGKSGCLETQVSVPALNARVQADPDATGEVLAEAGRLLGRALAPVVGMLGLQQIVIGGPDDLVRAELLDAVRAEITERTRSDFRPELDLRGSSLGRDAVLLGAAALVLLNQLGIS